MPNIPDDATIGIADKPHGGNRRPSAELELHYERLCIKRCDICEHLPTLRRLGEECESIVELGTRRGWSTTAFLAAQPLHLTTVDIRDCRNPTLMRLAGRTTLEFIRSDSVNYDVGGTDLLFIDTWHTREQVFAELTRHGDQVRKILAFHDTVTFGFRGQDGAEGLLAGINSWRSNHPEWVTAEEHPNNNGLLVLRRR